MRVRCVLRLDGQKVPFSAQKRYTSYYPWLMWRSSQEMAIGICCIFEVERRPRWRRHEERTHIVAFRNVSRYATQKICYGCENKFEIAFPRVVRSLLFSPI